MLRAVVGTFLDSLSEREFDAPLLALLAAQGFTDIHFIHGSFEFGKDVIAKRADGGGQATRQYSIQSKAGNIGQADWRSIRPQLEECEYNTRAHPSFDKNLPRVAVLVTTGRLKGSAPTDAQEFREACENRGLADFEVWERGTLLDWLCLDPSLGLTEIPVQDNLIAFVGRIGRHEMAEPMLERHSRRWLLGDDDEKRLASASIEASLICSQFRIAHRLDLAALAALHLYRAAWQASTVGAPSAPSPVAQAALRLFVSYSVELLDQAEPLLGDPKDLARSVMDIGAVITYPAVCCRLAEIFSLLSLLGTDGVPARASAAVRTLAAEHPGTARPPSDHFGASVVPTVVALARSDKAIATQYLRKVSTWLLDRHDPAKDGLGLGSLDEDERTQFERLVAGSTTITHLELRNSSYLASVVLDALWAIGAAELYDAVRENLIALRVVASTTVADEEHARWRRGGANVFPHPRVDYLAWVDRAAETPHLEDGSSTSLDAVTLGSVCRSRHDASAISELIEP